MGRGLCHEDLRNVDRKVWVSCKVQKLCPIEGQKKKVGRPPDEKGKDSRR